MPLQDRELWGRRGAIAGCHCSVLWFGGEGEDQLWGSEQTWCHCWVPFQGAIVVGYRGEGEGDGQLWGSGRGAIAGCH